MKGNGDGYNAIGVCAICGDYAPLVDRKGHPVRQNRSGIAVCPACKRYGSRARWLTVRREERRRYGGDADN